MRRHLLRTALLPVTVAAIFLGMATTPLLAQTCTVYCSASTLSCTGFPCSATATQLFCGGKTTTCSQADAWCSCRADCVESCQPACENFPGTCGSCINFCTQNNCGVSPWNTTCNF